MANKLSSIPVCEFSGFDEGIFTEPLFKNNVSSSKKKKKTSHLQTPSMKVAVDVEDYGVSYSGSLTNDNFEDNSSHLYTAAVGVDYPHRDTYRDEDREDYRHLIRPPKKTATLKDAVYVPVDRDDSKADRLSRKMKTLPDDASFAARYTAGIMLMDSDRIFTPGAYILAPELSKCPHVVKEIWPSAGIVYIGPGKRIFFNFVNDNGINVTFELEKFSSDGTTFADNMLDKLHANYFYWSEEPIVVTFNATVAFSNYNDYDYAEEKKQSLVMVSSGTGPFTSAIFYGGQAQGGALGVFSRMKPIFETPKKMYSDLSSRVRVFCPYDVMVSICTKHLNDIHI